MRRSLVLFALISCSVAASAGRAGAQSGGAAFVWFEQYLDALRQQAAVPGLSAAILADGDVVWEQGFGFGDVESSSRATPDTPYQIGDLTSTFAATLLLQCVERGMLQLDDPMGQFAATFPQADATVRHVLVHASQGPPGTRFDYDSSRYASLTTAIEDCTDRSYRTVLAHDLLDRLGMASSVPGQDVVESASDFDNQALDHYERILQRLATPYRVDRRNRPSPSTASPPGLSAAAGLISTVRDLARFDAALDDHVLLTPETLAGAWSNVTSRDGSALPVGLGWFVQGYRGERIVWHFGLVSDSSSSLIIKAPARRLTLILLANSDGLSAGFSLEAGDLTESPFARLFLQLFI
jgi:CubicO group peptidase (beta-lactamase class C family)